MTMNIERVEQIVKLKGLNTDKAVDIDNTLNVQGAATLQSTLAVTGAITATGGVVGAVTGNVTGNFTGNHVPAAGAAEHGAGAIGTGAAPTTTRWTDGGIIITETKIDIQGLASVATANDVIGLAAGGNAYVGRNVVATNGIIFKTQFACLETPTGGDNDVNLVINTSGTLAYDGAGGTTYYSNSGDLLAGQCVENLLPAPTADYYYYLTAGTGDTAATYTAGMYVLTTWGHALLA